MSIFDQAVVSLMPLVPKVIVGHVARPYIAGDTLTTVLPPCGPSWPRVAGAPWMCSEKR